MTTEHEAKPEPSMRTDSQLSPVRLLFFAALLVSLPEAGIMALLHYWLSLPAFVEAMIDTASLTVIIIPVLYFFMFRPLRSTIESETDARQELQASEAKYRTFFENVQDTFYQADNNGMIVEISPSVERYGYTRTEMIGTPILDVYEDPAQRADVVRSVIEQGEVEDYEIRLKAADGHIIDVSLNAHARYDASGERVGIEGTMRDITSRKQMEKALRESEAKFSVMAEASPAATFIFQGTGLCYVNAAAEAMTGYSREELLAMSFWDMIHPDYREQVKERGEARQRGEQVESAYELMLLTKDGRGCWVEFAGGSIEFNGRPAGIGTAFDITSRKQAESALRESEERFRRIFAESPIGMAIVSLDYRFANVNSSLCEMLGYSDEELTALTFPDITHPADVDKDVKLANQLFAGEIPFYEIEKRYIRKTGETIWVNLNASVVRGQSETPLYGLAMIEDITKRKQAEKALRESEAKFSVMAEASPAATFIFQGTGLRYVNAAAEAMTGYSREELLAMSFWDMIHPDYREQVKERAEARQRGEQVESAYELMLLTKDGSGCWVEFAGGSIEFNGRPAGIGTAFDITERKQAESALEQSLEAERERARRDPLTGALNHGAIIEELRERCSSAGESPVTVAMVDLDGLKAINDTYGHQLGDQALVIVANVLSQDNAIAGRYGGDEFVVILPGAGRAEAERYRDAVTAKLRDARLSDPETDAKIQVVASWGLAVFPEEAGTIADIIHLSDSAMYAAKRQRPTSRDAQATGRLMPGDRAAMMVGQIVPLLTSFGDLTEKLRLASRRLAVGAGYDAVNFTLFKEVAGQSITSTTYPSLPQQLTETWDRAQQPDSESHPLTSLLAKTLRPVILDDPWNDEHLWDSERKLLRAAQLRSVLVAPMICQDDMIGTIGVASKQLAAFGADDAQFLSEVATQVTAIVRMETLVSELGSTTRQLSQAQEESVLLLAAAAEAHDHTTGLHLQGVRNLTEALARELGYAEADASALGLASVLHDIGKVRVPDTILTSPAKLEGGQWEIMKQHTIWGADFLNGHPGFGLAATVALHHHERWDGSGYPAGIAGDAIPEEATIVTVADAFDAITHNRPYRGGRSVDEAVAEIAAHAGRQFSPNVAQALERLYQRNGLPAANPEVSDTEAAA